MVFACMAGTAIISLVSVREDKEGIEYAIGENEGIKIASLIVFAILGFPLAVSAPVFKVSTNSKFSSLMLFSPLLADYL